MAKIGKLTEEINQLKKLLKPLPPLVQMSLAECNKGMRAARMAKFAAKNELSNALASVIAKEARAKAKGK